jgi:hypothetical protein
MLEEYLKSPLTRTTIMVLLGIGLATIFRETCKEDRCIVVEAPDPTNVEGKKFKFDKTCYKFNAKLTSCD